MYILNFGLVNGLTHSRQPTIKCSSTRPICAKPLTFYGSRAWHTEGHFAFASVLGVAGGDLFDDQREIRPTEGL